MFAGGFATGRGRPLGEDDMCRWRLVLVAGLYGLVAWDASAQTLTEEQALARMRTEHPQLRVLQLTVRELEAATRERSLRATRR